MGSALLGALSFAILAVPITFTVGVVTLRCRRSLRPLAFVASVTPWLAYPLFAMASFVPSGERGQWIELFMLSLIAAAIGAVVGWRSHALSAGSPSLKNDNVGQKNDFEGFCHRRENASLDCVVGALSRYHVAPCRSRANRCSSCRIVLFRSEAGGDSSIRSDACFTDKSTIDRRRVGRVRRSLVARKARSSNR